MCRKCGCDEDRVRELQTAEELGRVVQFLSIIGMIAFTVRMVYVLLTL